MPAQPSAVHQQGPAVQHGVPQPGAIQPSAVKPHAPSDKPDSTARYAWLAALCLAYIGVSTLLIRFNKFLMHPERFPFSMTLSALHMFFSLAMCSLFYLWRPAAFPGMAASEGKRAEVAKWFVPIGAFFAISLFASNQAYLYCNVAFLQFMKEGNVILTFLISCAAGLQVMNRVRLAVILWIMLGSTLCVSSELTFHMLGFVMQLVSQVAECSRVVLGEFVLSGSNFKLDPLTYTMFAAPACLAALLLAHIFVWDAEMLQRASQWWMYLLPNMSLAFVLNVLVATIIKEVSAVGFILTGLMKDVILVLISALVFREVVTGAQYLSFSMLIAGVLFWSLMRASPEHPAVRFVEAALGLPGEPSERTSLLQSKANKV